MSLASSSNTSPMKLIVYDIETAPLPNLGEIIATQYPFDANDVKVGNLKDPLKIAEKIAEARAGHEDGIRDKAQLDPSLSYVCAIGWDEGDGLIKYVAGGLADEPVMINRFWNMMAGQDQHTQFAGWNCHKFDLPFMVRRTWILRARGHEVYLPPVLFGHRGFANNQIDLMKVWCCNQYGEFASLKRVAKTLGVSCERDYETTGKDFWKVLAADEATALQYLSDDIAETAAIARALIGRSQVFA